LTFSLFITYFMTKFTVFIFTVLCSFCLISCTKKPDLKGFDVNTWKKDKGGCNGLRASQEADFKKLKQELKGVSSNDILSLFGPPDIQRLSERNQEYFVYFMEKGPHCGAIKPISDARTVIIRFSAIKLATEITFQNGSL
jgi:hypothetical protein